MSGLPSYQKHWRTYLLVAIAVIIAISFYGRKQAKLNSPEGSETETDSIPTLNLDQEF